MQLTTIVKVVLIVWIAGAECYTPVVMYHGMGDTAYGSINQIKNYLEEQLPGIYVTSIETGDNPEADFFNSYFLNLNTQVSQACDKISKDDKLANGYNAIGFSQGGQIMRAIAQRCATPSMKNLISIGGQHQGVYGLPRCFGDDYRICDIVRKMINLGAYLPYVQDTLVQAEYWHDPLEEGLYRSQSVFLADVNNEKDNKNLDYKNNLAKLTNFVMVMFLNETIVEPKESEWFEFYESGSTNKIVPLVNSSLYAQDWIGLKTLDDSGRLKRLATLGDHLQFSIEWFHKQIVEPYLAK